METPAGAGLVVRIAIAFALAALTSSVANADEKREEQKSTGLKPLTEMTAQDRYKGEDGGLYGGGRNEPPKEHQAAATEALKKITPLDAQGKPTKDGKIVFISLGMSNAAGEFAMFKEIADRDPRKSPDVLIVNCAIGGAGVSSWAKPRSGTWNIVAERLKQAHVAPAQVQVAWIKHAEPGPAPDTANLQYAKKVKEDIAASLAITRSTFPNLRVAYLSSRIYGGYNMPAFAASIPSRSRTRLRSPSAGSFRTRSTARRTATPRVRSSSGARTCGPTASGRARAIS